jgi:protocatechuate 3,4-dioxygenase beta subunit
MGKFVPFASWAILLPVFCGLAAGLSRPAPAEQVQETDTRQVPSTTTISGSCLDENKRPLPNARVRLFLIDFYSEEKSQRQLQEVQTDDQGKFRLTDVDIQQVRDQRAALEVVAQSPGRATVTSRWLGHKQASKTFDNLTLPPAATMKGRIVNAEGRPVVGAIVSTATGLPMAVEGICAAVTDADGNYAITDLRPFDVANHKPHPTGDGGFMMITACNGKVEHPDYARQPFRYTKIPSTIDVTVHKSAVVHGQIVLAEKDEPASGARLEFWNDTVASDYWTRTTTDAGGNYRLANLPPGKYRMSVRVQGRPNLFRHDVELTSGDNALDLKLEKGATIIGQVIDVTTGKPVQLGKGQIMQISTSDSTGISYAGMPYANIEPNGTFTLLVPAGRQYLGMYFGPNWRGVNTDELFNKGLVLKEGEVFQLDIQVTPVAQKRK